MLDYFAHSHLGLIVDPEVTSHCFPIDPAGDFQDQRSLSPISARAGTPKPETDQILPHLQAISKVVQGLSKESQCDRAADGSLCVSAQGEEEISRVDESFFHYGNLEAVLTLEISLMRLPLLLQR